QSTMSKAIDLRRCIQIQRYPLALTPRSQLVVQGFPVRSCPIGSSILPSFLRWQIDRGDAHPHLENKGAERAGAHQFFLPPGMKTKSDVTHIDRSRLASRIGSALRIR